MRGVYASGYGVTESVEVIGDKFKAGGDLTLHCDVLGHNGNLLYNWSVMNNTIPSCAEAKECSIDTTSNTSTLMVGIYSFNAGIYTCTVNEKDKSLSTNSDTFSVKFVG